MLKVNTFNYNVGLVNNQPLKKETTLLPKYNLKADTVSFTSMSLFRQKTLLEKVIAFIKPKPSPEQIVRTTLQYASQVASLIGSAIAIATLVL
ncbi:MAG: hypothetical protein AB1782_06900 [Cyanobacteriota bacterium]